MLITRDAIKTSTELGSGAHVVEVLTEALAAPVLDADSAINRILLEMGKFSRVDRAYVFQRKTGDLLDNTHEWCEVGIDPMKDALQDLPMDMIAPWRDGFERGESFHAPSIADLQLPQEIRSFLEMQGIKGMLLVPLRAEGSIIGFSGYDSVREEHTFTEDEVRILIAMSGAIGTILARVLADQKIASSRRELHHQAMHDDLTGAPNRRSFMSALTGSLSRGLRDNSESSIGIIDLVRFKTVNETYGHGAGDELLREITHRWRLVAGHEMKLFRVGGDEFAVLIDGPNSQDRLTHIVQEMRDSIREPFIVHGEQVCIDMSVGIALLPRDGVTVEEVSACADIALFQSKSIGGRTCFYDAEMRHRATRRHEIAQELLLARPDHDFIIHYQPIVSLGDEKIMGFEALLRWKHCSLGELQPGYFIDALCGLERSLDIGKWVLFRACKQAAEWSDLLGRDLFICVNAFPLQFTTLTFLDDIQDALIQSGLSGKQLEIEVTENIAMQDGDACKEIIRKIGLLGVSIALDDFGTGFANLSSLLEVKVQTLKVDRSFISDVCGDERKFAVLQAIRHIAQQLGIKTVVEGIDEEHLLGSVQQLGFDYGQGFYWSEPLEASRFTEAFEMGRSLVSRKK